MRPRGHEPERHSASALFDVAIAGAGPAGSALALRLARAGCRVALVERSRFERFRIGETLAPGIRSRLVALGAWDDFMRMRPLPCWGVASRWGEDRWRSQSHLLHPEGNGWHVDRAGFDALLARRAECAGAALRLGRAVVETSPSPMGWQVTTRPAGPNATGPDDTGAASTDVLRARVWVDATGRGARLARAAGAQMTAFDRLVGIARVQAGGRSQHAQHLRLAACELGWRYQAPLPPPAPASTPQLERLVNVLMTDADLAHRAGLARTARREAAASPRASGLAANAGKGPPGQFLSIGVHPARSQRLRREPLSLGSHWLAVGDAALAVDPLSGSGVLRALDQAEEAAATVLGLLDGQGRPALEAHERRLDLACDRYLRERARLYQAETRWPEADFWARRGRRRQAA